MHFKTDAFFCSFFLKRCNNKVSRFALLSCHNMPHDPFCIRAKLDEDTHMQSEIRKEMTPFDRFFLSPAIVHTIWNMPHMCHVATDAYLSRQKYMACGRDIQKCRFHIAFPLHPLSIDAFCRKKVVLSVRRCRICSLGWWHNRTVSLSNTPQRTAAAATTHLDIYLYVVSFLREKAFIWRWIIMG